MAKATKKSPAPAADGSPVRAAKKATASKPVKGSAKTTASAPSPKGASSKSAPKATSAKKAASAAPKATAAKKAISAKKATSTAPKATSAKKAVGANKASSAAPKASAKKTTAAKPAAKTPAPKKTAARKSAAPPNNGAASTPRKPAAPAKPILTVADLNRQDAAPVCDHTGKLIPRVQNPVLTARQKREIKQALLDERDRVLTFIADVDAKSIGHNRGDGERSRSSYSIHQADYASDNQSLNLALMQRQIEAQRLEAIEWALKRFNTKNFGKCRRCSANIGYERMQAVPYADYCILCRSDMESPDRP